MDRYRKFNKNKYNKKSSGVIPFILLIVVILGIVGFKYKEEIKTFLVDTYNEISGNDDNVSAKSAKQIFLDNKETFEKALKSEDIEILRINDLYISIIDRYDFGGRVIRAFRFQTKGDLTTEIVYSEREPRETPNLEFIEKNWYIYTFKN